MATSDPLVLLRRRLTIAENARFTICLDDVVDEHGNGVSDYLAVLPRVAGADGVTGIAVLPVCGDRFGLIRMFRHPYGAAGWEVPMGFMDGGESPVEAALRELQEETGLQGDSGRLQDLGMISPVPSIVNARIRLYAAHVPKELPVPPAAEVGQGRLGLFDHREILELAANGEIFEPCTLISFYRFAALA